MLLSTDLELLENFEESLDPSVTLLHGTCAVIYIFDIFALISCFYNTCAVMHIIDGTCAVISIFDDTCAMISIFSGTCVVIYIIDQVGKQNY